MFSIFTYIMSRVTHSEPGLPMIYLGNESQCCSEGKTTTIEDHLTLVLHSVDFKKHYITFDL